jgi:hypothetical protein
VSPRPKTSWPTASTDAIVDSLRDDPDTGVVVERSADLSIAAEEWLGGWIDAGLRQVAFELLAVESAAHDYVVGRAGQADAIVAALERARTAGVVTHVRTEVHRSTFRGLHELPRLLLQCGVSRWQLTWPHEHDLSRRVPRLGLAVPHTLRAASIAGRLGLDVELVDFPLCVLGPMRTRARATRPWDHPSDETASSSPCTSCSARERCAGAGRDYVRQHGLLELRALVEPAKPQAR